MMGSENKKPLIGGECQIDHGGNKTVENEVPVRQSLPPRSPSSTTQSETERKSCKKKRSRHKLREWTGRDGLERAAGGTGRVDNSGAPPTSCASLSRARPSSRNPRRSPDLWQDGIARAGVEAKVAAVEATVVFAPLSVLAPPRRAGGGKRNLV